MCLNNQFHCRFNRLGGVSRSAKQADAGIGLRRKIKSYKKKHPFKRIR